MTLRTTALSVVLQHPALWRGSECASVNLPSLPTGFPALDALLPGGGWPRGALTELLPTCLGVGEMRLILPALQRLTQAGQWVVLIDPPHIPYAPALAAAGVRLARLAVVRPSQPPDSLWAAEQALRAGCCGAVVCWPITRDQRVLRRLQLAAEAGKSWGVLYRPAALVTCPSPAPLRIAITTVDRRIAVTILKRRGGSAPAPLYLSPDKPAPWPDGPPTVKVIDATPSPRSSPSADGRGAERNEQR